MNEKAKSMITSRRFQVLAASMLLVFSEDLFGVKLDQDKLEWAVGLAAAWILGDSYRKTV